jgi:hypothetical protein
LVNAITASVVEPTLGEYQWREFLIPFQRSPAPWY